MACVCFPFLVWVCRERASEREKPTFFFFFLCAPSLAQSKPDAKRLTRKLCLFFFCINEGAATWMFCFGAAVRRRARSRPWLSPHAPGSPLARKRGGA